MLKERVMEAGDARIAMELGADAVFDEHGKMQRSWRKR